MSIEYDYHGGEVEPKLGPASYSFHNNWENCPRKSYHIHIARDLPKEQESAALIWGNKVHKVLEDYLMGRCMLPAEMVHYAGLYSYPQDYQIETEMMLGIKEDGSPCHFFDDDVWLRGKIDVVLTLAERPEFAILTDHKTGNKREDPYELMMHAVLLKAKFPQLTTIKGWYNWLKTVEMGPVHDLSDTEAVLKGIRWTRRKIEEAFKLGYEAFPPKQNPLCGWCSVKQCEFNPHHGRS